MTNIEPVMTSGNLAERASRRFTWAYILMSIVPLAIFAYFVRWWEVLAIIVMLDIGVFFFMRKALVKQVIAAEQKKAEQAEKGDEHLDEEPELSEVEVTERERKMKKKMRVVTIGLWTMIIVSLALIFSEQQ